MPATVDKIWTKTTKQIRTLQNTETYNLWVSAVQPLSLNQSSIILEVPNEFSEGWLKDNYLELLQDALTQASGRKLKIKFKVKAIIYPYIERKLHFIIQVYILN